MEFLNAIPMDTSQLFEIGLQWGGTLLSALAGETSKDTLRETFRVRN